MDRRGFIAMLIAAGAALSSRHVFAGGRHAADPAGRLVETLRHRRSAATVGRAFLGQHPHEADARRLTTLLSDDLRRRRCDPAGARRTRLRTAISDQVRDDFAAGRVVNVRGWVLSATEARLCGLAALSA